MLFSDVQEIKSILEIDPENHAEDKKLYFFNEWASGWIEEQLNRPMVYRSRTEYYNGTGTQKLLLRSRPVYPRVGESDEIQVFVDEAGFFGSMSGSFGSETEFVYGEDFCLQLDPGEDGLSRSGLLIRINNLWPLPSVRQRGLLSPFLGTGFGTIKVIYTAGYKIDTLPAQLRAACCLLVARLRYLFPLGMELSSDSYEERSIGMAVDRDDYILSVVKPMFLPYRNWRW